MYRFVESIRVENGEFQHLEYHQKRLTRTMSHFGTNANPHLLSECITIPSAFGVGVYKCRVVYDAEIREVAFLPYVPKAIQTLKLVVSDEASYPFKFEDRTFLLELLKQKGRADDILIVKNGFLTDTSFANVALFDGSEWYTPDTFLLNGTARQRLIAEGRLKEAKIRIQDLKNFDGIKPINAMLNFEETPSARIFEEFTTPL